eukprot:TRINITY_DN6319_c1_g2_i4.p2 TRINITY_DN6319_c1_g2~~TRINITY_DN6319_c1_g2_i4.p2  ORF type:complete len:202 (-),score=25.72 TRINITY_DN6319_c1_g2_i4:100-705(-)
MSALFWSLIVCGSLFVNVRSHELWGTVSLPDYAYESADVRVVLSLNGGGLQEPYLRSARRFLLTGVPPGTHLLDVFAMGWGFPQLRVQVSERGSVKVSLSTDWNKVLLYVTSSFDEGIPTGMRIKPILEMKYFQEKPPFNIRGFLFSPTGIFILIAAVGVFVLPRMKVDPEEYKKMQEELQSWQNQGQGQQQIQGGAQRRR